MKFIDEIELNLQAGNGGSGCASFTSYYRNPKAGPDGGNGGKGGDIYFQGNEQINSFFSLSFKKRWVAEKGENGKSKARTGREGQDIYIQLPLGTIIKLNSENGEENLEFLNKELVLGEILLPRQTLLIARGGRGGKGNAAFASSINRAPNYAQNGQPGERLKLKLELRILAEIGLLGLPNVGKSTLTNSLSEAKIKTANFPFTTLFPQLAIIKDSKEKIKIADLPGIIEGAWQGKGLGLRFLQHVARCRIIALVLDASLNPLEDLRILQKELVKSNFLSNKPKAFILNKMDLISQQQKKTLEEIFSREKKEEKVFFLSALHRTGLENLVNGLSKLIQKTDENIDFSSHDFHKVYDLTVPIDWKLISLRPRYWKLTGLTIDKLIKKHYFEKEKIIQEIKKLPLEEILNQNEVKKGDTIIIDEQEFTWS